MFSIKALYQPFCAQRRSWVYRESCSCLPGLQRPERRRFFPSYRQASFFIGNIPQNHSKLRSTGAGERGRWIFSACDIQNSPLPHNKKKNPEIWIKLKSVRAMRSGSGDRERMQSLSVGLSACGLYLYLALHANGSCETSQTFFPTVTFHQSGRGTRGPREDGSWSAPSHWLFGRLSWRPMARGPGSGHSRGNCLQSSINVPFTY